jgi:hypothetical protein
MSTGLEFQKMSSTAIPSFFAVVNAFFNLNFPRSLWQKNLCTTAIALSALVKFEPWSTEGIYRDDDSSLTVDTTL